MNLLNVLKVMAVIVFLMVVSSIQAQDFISVVKVDDQTCVASNAEEFETLTSMVKLINSMKQAKANGTIDSTMYAEKTASVMKDARDAGIRMRKNN